MTARIEDGGRVYSGSQAILQYFESSAMPFHRVLARRKEAAKARCWPFATLADCGGAGSHVGEYKDWYWFAFASNDLK